MPWAGKVTGLNAADRQVLSGWLTCAAARGVDTVMDLSIRPWNIGGAAVIVGVFETNKNQASWLVVREHSGWTLARCKDGFVSGLAKSLPDILALIDAAAIGGKPST